MRIRQFVFAARDLAPAAEALATLLALDPPFADPGVAEFGLHNAVFVFGDQFIELVSPVQPGTAAGRHLDRQGDGGYMLILQTDRFDAHRARLDALGVRRVWSVELPDIRAMHLHPKDIGGAIVSIDEPLPAESWRWGGPGWRRRHGRASTQRIVAVRIAAADPSAMARRWAEVLDLAAPAPHGSAQRLALEGGWVDFEPAGARGEGVAGCTLAVAERGRVLARATALGLPVAADGFRILGMQIELQ